MNALAYHEPPLETLLPLSSFLIALHFVAWPLNRLFSAGLLGQILVGIVWGTPLTSWLDINTQQTIVQLGYIGLILLVFEGHHPVEDS
jgi:Kef-type K+ transport system membrane component KefB